MGTECVSRNAKDLMLRSKLPALRAKFAMPHCTNHFELHGFCAYPPARKQSLPVAYEIDLVWEDNECPQKTIRW
jgi:hypothetical protein